MSEFALTVFVFSGFKRLLELVHGLQHLLVVRAVVLVDLLGRSQVGQVPVILRDVHQSFGHVRSEDLAELSEVQVTVIVPVDVLQHGLDFVRRSLHLDAVQALLEVIVADIAVAVLVELAEHLEQLHLTIKDLVLNLVDELADARVVHLLM